MDRERLMQRLLPFVELGKQQGLPFEIVRLDDAIPGLTDDNYIVRIAAPWAVGKTFDEIMDPLLDLLWRSTSAEEREGISMLLVSPSREQILTQPLAESLAYS